MGARKRALRAPAATSVSLYGPALTPEYAALDQRDSARTPRTVRRRCVAWLVSALANPQERGAGAHAALPRLAERVAAPGPGLAVRALQRVRGCSTLFQRLDASRDGRISLDELISITRHTFRIHERCHIWTDGWMDGWMDGWSDSHLFKHLVRRTIRCRMQYSTEGFPTCGWCAGASSEGWRSRWDEAARASTIRARPCGCNLLQHVAPACLLLQYELT